MRKREIMSENQDNNVYIPSEVLSEQEQNTAERFVTDLEKGLGQEDVKNRVAQGKVNGDTNVKTKSVAQILRENIVTFSISYLSHLRR